MPGEFLEIYSYHLLLATLHYSGPFLFCAKSKQYFIIVRQRFGPFPPKYNMNIETLAQNISYSLRRTALIADRRDQTTTPPQTSEYLQKGNWVTVTKGRNTEGQQTEGKQIKPTKSQQNQKLCADKINEQKKYTKKKSKTTKNCICYWSSSTSEQGCN